MTLIAQRTLVFPRMIPLNSHLMESKPPKILIVDDEPSICWAFRQLLQAEGWHAFTAASAEEGLEVIAAEHPDLVVLDVRLPGISGIDAIPKFRALNADLPI